MLRSATKAIHYYRCQKSFPVALNCHVNHRCVWYGRNQFSKECVWKSLNRYAIVPRKRNNCGLSHPSNYTGCSNFPTKPQLKTNLHTNFCKVSKYSHFQNVSQVYFLHGTGVIIVGKIFPDKKKNNKWI